MPPLAAPLIDVGLIAKEYRATRTNLTLDFRKIPAGRGLKTLSPEWFPC
jgi:hypothetical protein